MVMAGIYDALLIAGCEYPRGRANASETPDVKAGATRSKLSAPSLAPSSLSNTAGSEYVHCASKIGVICCALDYFNLLAIRQTGPSERPVLTRRKSCSWSLVHDEAKASVDRVEMKEISMAGMPGAGVEILTQAFDPRLDVVGG